MTALQKAEPHGSSIVPVNESASILAIIAKAATDPNCDVDKMERLYAMHERMQAHQAMVSYQAAMTEAQAEMLPVARKHYNVQTKSWYAKVENIDAEIRPIYTRHGFSLSFSEGKADKADDIRVICKVAHRDGHSESFYYDGPLDDKGIQGSVNKTKTHAKGSTITYSRRYLTLMIFNLATGQDDDGNGAGGQVDDAGQKANDWINTANQIQTPDDYAKQRERLVKDYGGKENAIPAPVKQAFNKAKAAVMPKDE